MTDDNSIEMEFSQLIENDLTIENQRLQNLPPSTSGISAMNIGRKRKFIELSDCESN